MVVAIESLLAVDDFGVMTKRRRKHLSFLKKILKKLRFDEVPMSASPRGRGMMERKRLLIWGMRAEKRLQTTRQRVKDLASSNLLKMSRRMASGKLSK